MPPFIDRLVQLSANRGASATAHHLARDQVRVGEVDIVDLKPGRAEALARDFALRGARARATEGEGAAFLEGVSPEVPAIVAVDDLATTALVTARETHRDLVIQGVIQGEGRAGMPGVVLGLHVASLVGRGREQAAAATFFAAVARSVERASSAAMRTDPVSALRLALERDGVGRVTAASLPHLERVRQEDSLAALFWQGERYPLTVVHSSAETRSAREEQALESVVGRGAVALVLGPAHLLVVLVDRRGGARGRVRLTTEFSPPPPVVVRPTRTIIDVAPTPATPSRSGRQPAQPASPEPRVSRAHFTD